MGHGREVGPGQLARPAKEVKKRGYKPAAKDVPLELEDDQASRADHTLYQPWALG